MLRTAIIIFWVIFTATVYLVFYIFPGLIFVSDKQKFFCSCARSWFGVILKSIGIQLGVAGVENIPKDHKIILVSNHESIADIFILGAAVPLPFRFLAKEVLFKIPFIGLCMKLRGDIPIVREERESAHRTLDKVAGFVSQGIPVHIFPEGTRTPNGEMRDFRRGAFIIAYKTGAPVVPIAITGSFHILPKGKFKINPTKVKVSIGSPIHFTKCENVDQDTLWKSVHEVRSIIADMIKKNRVKDDAAPLLNLKPR